MVKSSVRGFTLIELMLTVAIIGILSAIALPKFADMVIRAKEAAIRGQLGSLRSALSLYYANNEGVWPTIAGLDGGPPPNGHVLTLGGRYLNEYPVIRMPYNQDVHPPASRPNTMFFFSPISDINWLTDEMAYSYNPNTGDVRLNCDHPDSRGTIWSNH